MPPFALFKTQSALASAALVLLYGAVSLASDPGAARAQLQRGYSLKQSGKCAEAIPYFIESIRRTLIGDSLIPRPESATVIERLTAADSKRIIVVRVSRRW